MYYFNPETGGFHSEQFDGPKKIAVPQTEREKKAGKRPRMIDNPDCRIPQEAVPITSEQYEELMTAQANGKVIVAKGGKPAAVDHQPDPEEQRHQRRMERDRRLAASDWTQLIDSPLPEAQHGPWQAYRQQLRDLDMDGIDWPTPPSGAAQ